MGQRHNRRRTRFRPRSRNGNICYDDDSSTSTPIFDSSCLASSPLVTCGWRDSLSPSLAPTWHHGFVTWEACHRPPRLETEQCRLFGGEPGDDVDLCYRMLEYFGGLDYIDS